MKLLLGDALQQMRTLEGGIVQTCITSPPYWGLRDYGVQGQIGLEKTPEAFCRQLVEVFREVRRVLKDDGTLWINLGDCYAQSQYGSGGGWAKSKAVYDNAPAQDRSLFKDPGYEHGLKTKDLVGVPWRVAFALQGDGWYLRQDIIWHKPNPMPESVTDRCTKAHEYIFLLSKSERYFFDNDAIREPHQDKAGVERYTRRGGGLSASDYEKRKWTGRSDGLSRPPITMKVREYNPLGRNRRSVWTVPTKPYRGAHFATFPPDLIEPCILAGAMGGDTVLDPFMGTGTVGVVAHKLCRDFIGIELNPAYLTLAHDRIQASLLTAAE